MVPWSDMDKESTVPGVSQANQHFCLFLQLINTTYQFPCVLTILLFFILKKKNSPSVRGLKFYLHCWLGSDSVVILT